MRRVKLPISERPVIRIELRPEGDCGRGEMLRGLRWLLKRVLRQYGLRCLTVSIDDSPPPLGIGKDERSPRSTAQAARLADDTGGGSAESN